MRQLIFLRTQSLPILLIVILIPAVNAAVQYISADTYTRYELLAPESHQFKIYYEVTETRAGEELAIVLEGG